MVSYKRYLLAIALPVITALSATAQTAVKGKVVDEDNAPLAGVFVSVREGTQGEVAMTDDKGEQDTGQICQVTGKVTFNHIIFD